MPHVALMPFFALMLVTAGCAVADTQPTVSDALASPVALPAAECAHVEAVDVRRGETAYVFDVTVRSADTGWDKYADRWEVRSPDGGVLGVRELTHPHETEQPFTRSLSGVAIPDEIAVVTVAAHDSVAGFCGEVQEIALPAR